MHRVNRHIVPNEKIRQRYWHQRSLGHTTGESGGMRGIPFHLVGKSVEDGPNGQGHGQDDDEPN